MSAGDSGPPSPGRRRFVVAAASLLAVGMTGAAVREAYAFQRVVRRASLAGLRSPLRVAWLADLHHGPWIGAASVEAWVDATLAEAPDLIVLGGDIVDQREGGSIDALVGELGRLRAPLGVRAVWGNHDRARFRRIETFEARLEAAGIEVLVNRGERIRHDLWLAGVDDLVTGDPDLPAALRDRPADAACILASHNPDLLPEVPVSVSLTLSGHTHGGQVVLPFIGPPFTSSRYGRRFASGWVRGPALGYVSRGLGFGLVPIRVNCPAELTILELAPVT